MLEIVLVIGMVAILSAFVMPSMLGQWTRAQLPESAQQLRALLQLTRANAMLDGYRYRIRFPEEGELDGQGDSRQPLVEVEDNPLEEPEEFRQVRAAWAQGEIFKEGVRCVQVRLGKPTIAFLLGEIEEEDDFQEELEEELEVSFDEGFPPLVIEPDGTSEWATFVLTNAPEDIDYEELELEDVDYQQVEVILDGLIGLCWLQRVLYEEELELFREKGWPPVMRKDFLDPDVLTEDNVLEFKDIGSLR